MRFSEELAEAVAMGKTGAYNVPTPAQVAKKYGVRSLRRDEISVEWVTGIRKWWKKIFAETKNYKGRPSESVSKVGTYQDIRSATDDSQAFLRSVYNRLKALQTDLVVLKGFVPLGVYVPAPGEAIKHVKEDEVSKKIAVELEIALEGLEDATRSMNISLGNYNPEKGSRYTDNLYRDVTQFSYAYASFAKTVDEVMAKVDKAVSSRLLRFLSKLVKQSGDEKGRYSHRTDRESEPVEDVVKVGRAKLIFQDYPTGPGGKVSISVPVHPPGIGGEETHVWAKQRSTVRRDDVVNHVRKAFAFLKKARLGHVFYGKIRVLPPETHRAVSRGRASGALAVYMRGPDDVHLYGDALAAYDTIIHELGHRYYHKFLTRQERLNFGKWFGKSKAVSQYGSTNEVEDFAELFTHYVMGKKLTRDQRQRMGAFLGRKRRSESLADELAASLMEVAS